MFIKKFHVILVMALLLISVFLIHSVPVSLAADQIFIAKDNDTIAAAPGLDAESFLKQFSGGEKLAGADGKALSGTDKIGTGATVTDHDGKNLILIVPGDVNGEGKVNSSDARLALRASARIETLEGPFFAAADINGDGKLKSNDARAVLRIAAKLDSITDEILRNAAKNENPSKEEISTTEAATTDEPTTAAPTTDEPTTAAPTTEKPTTAAPTTEKPTTEAPTTDEPTTAAPATEEPTTAAPATEEPTTEAPATEEPTTEAPATEEPTTAAPATEEPTTAAPETEESSTAAPATEESSTDTPAPEEPTTAAPIPEEPTTAAPAPEEPTTDPTAPEEPTTDTPVPEEPTTDPTAPEEPMTEPQDENDLNYKDLYYETADESGDQYAFGRSGGDVYFYRPTAETDVGMLMLENRDLVVIDRMGKRYAVMTVEEQEAFSAAMQSYGEEGFSFSSLFKETFNDSRLDIPTPAKLLESGYQKSEGQWKEEPAEIYSNGNTEYYYSGRILLAVKNDETVMEFTVFTEEPDPYMYYYLDEAYTECDFINLMLTIQIY